VPQGGINIDISGEKELIRSLDSLEPKVAKKIVRQALRPAMKEIITNAKGRAPVDSGALKKSLVTRAARRSRRNIGVLGIVRAERKANYYAAPVELGHKKKSGAIVPEQPFLRGAFDSLKDKAFRAVVNGFWSGIKEAWRK